jgi:serine/threonine-protein kinase
MPVDQALPLIHQLIDALEYAHENGIIHRDLKPANITVTPEGRVKVLDFGLAKAMNDDAPAGDPVNSPTLTMPATMAGVIMGTAAYMAPEQARGHAVEKRADIWAFGVVVYEILTGRMLFNEPSIPETLAAVLTVRAQLRRLLEFCLARDPRRRLRDISGARILLESAPPPAVARRHWLPWRVATALGFALLALGVLHFREEPPEVASVRFQIPLPDRVALGQAALPFHPTAAGSPSLQVVGPRKCSGSGRSIRWKLGRCMARKGWSAFRFGRPTAGSSVSGC